MIRPTAVISLATLSLIALGCGEPVMRKVHEGALIDNKVLQQRVEAALRRAGPEFNNVHVKADNGTVLLTGIVPSAKARAQADDISNSVYGVNTTDNQLSLKTRRASP